MKNNWGKRILSALLAFVMVLGYVPVTAFASSEDGLCEHHLQHTEECGYSPAVEAHDCGHEHTAECYQSVTECVHAHGDCGYDAETEEGCIHVCSEETQCVKQVLNCQHQHDAACGYEEAAAETPCGFECADCAKGASGEPAPTEYHGSTATEEDTTWGLRGASTFSLEGNSSDSLSSGFYRITTKLDRDYKLTLSSSSYSCVTTGESDSQVFYVSQLENGYFVIYDSSKASVVTARSSEFAEETQMELQEYSDIPQQHWAILPAKEDDGSYYIITAENEMYLDVNNADCYKNAIVKLFPRNVLYDAQNWFFEPCENYEDSDNCSCSEQYAGNYVVCNTSELAIRDGHSITSKQLGTIPLGTEISITKASGAAGSSDAWGHVTYNGISGYINMAYVEQQIESLGSGTCGAEGSNVTWNLTSDGTLTISGTGKMKDFFPMAYLASWYPLRDKILRIKIESGVTSIGDYAFWSCTSLISVTIPDSITSIGKQAFYKCSSLTCATIPNSVTSIGGSAFRECTGLTSVTISDSVTSINSFTFYKCTSLTSVSIPDKVTSIGDNAFNSCYSLASVTIPNSVTSIGNHAFTSCRLTSVTIPDSVTSIGAEAFGWCGRLTAVTIPNGVTSIGNYAFSHCGRLTSVTISNSVTSIGHYAFYDCRSLTSVTIPDSVIEAGGGVFAYCTSLSDINVDQNNKYWCSVDGVWLSKDMKTLIEHPAGRYGLYECPASVTSIADSAFDGCSSLTSVTIPNSVTSIGELAFCGCSNLKDIYYNGTGAQWGQISIGDYNTELTNATIHYNSNGSSSELTLVSTSPAVGAKNVALDEPFILTFSQNISPKLNWEEGGLYIRNRDTGAFAVTITNQEEFDSFGCYVQGNKLIMPVSFNTLAFNTSYSGKFCFLSDSGVITTANSSGDSTISWEGTRDKDDVVFTLRRNLIVPNTPFQLGKDSFSFNNIEWDYGSDQYSLLDPHDRILWSKLDPVNRFILTIKYYEEKYLGYLGHCFAMSALMGLFSSGHLQLSKIGGTTVFDLLKPIDDPYVKSYLSYYQLLQYAHELLPNKTSIISSPEKKLIDALEERRNPVLVMFSMDGMNQHAVLAYALDKESDPNYNLVYIADPNGLMDFPADATYPDKATTKDYMIPCYKVLCFSKYTNQYIGTISPMKGNYSISNSEYVSLNYVISDLDWFDAFSIESEDSHASSLLSTRNGSAILGTDARNFNLVDAESGNEIVVRNGIVQTGNLFGPYYSIGGESTDESAQYYLESAKNLEMIIFDEGSHTTYVGYIDSEKAMGVQSDSKRVSFSPSGFVSISETSSRSKLYASLNDDSDACVFSLETDVSYLTMEPLDNGSYQFASSMPLGEVKIGTFGLFGEKQFTSAHLSGSSALARPVQGDQYEISEQFTDIPIQIEQEYITLPIGDNTALSVSADSDALLDMIQWSVENNTADSEPVITVDVDGTVHAQRIGTAYVLAKVTIAGITYSDRCRIDVTELESKTAVTGVQLGTTALTTELFRTDYAEFDVILLLQQNQNPVMTADSISPDGAAPEGNGVAVDSAAFVDEKATNLFDLIVKDDRTLLVVPKQSAIDNPKPVAGKYTSKVRVTVDGREFVTDASLTLTVKKSTPKLKATALTFNPFYSEQAQAIKITGATVKSITQNTLPDWLTLENGVLTLNKAPNKGSANAVVSVQTEEWVNPVTVSVPVKLSYAAPQLKLSASSATFAAGEAYKASQGVTLKLQCANKNDTLEGLNVSGIQAPKGFEIQNFDPADGSFILKPTEAVVAGPKEITVSFLGTTQTVILKPKVSTKAVSIAAKPSTVTLNSVVGDSAAIPLTASPTDYQISGVNIRLTDSRGEAIAQDLLAYEYGNGFVIVRTVKGKTQPNATYKLYVSTKDTAKEIVLTVKTLADTAKTRPTVSAKITGSVDLSFPESCAVVTPIFKNYASGAVRAVNWTVTEFKGKTPVGNATAKFNFTPIPEKNQFQLSAKDGLVPGNTYQLSLTYTLSDDSTCSCTAKITVKRTPVKLKLSKTSLSLNKAIGDTAVVDVTCLTKGYDFTKPVAALIPPNSKDGQSIDLSQPGTQEPLTVSWSDGKLTVTANSNAEAGKTYKITLKATKNDPAVTLSVRILDAAVTASLKAKGTIDVVRDSTAITVTPTYKNYMGLSKINPNLTIESSGDKWKTLTDVTSSFAIAKNDNGTYTIAKKPGAAVDTSLKYRAKLTFDGNPNPAYVNLTVKSGTAKVAASNGVVLYKSDRFSRDAFRLTTADKALDSIVRAEIKDPKYQQMFEVHSYGNSEFAIGFANDTVPAGKLPASFVLNVYVSNAQYAKPVASVTLKLQVQ